MKFRLRSVLILLACAHLMTACTDPSASQNSDASDTTGVDADQSLDPDTAGPDTAGPDTSRPDTSGPDTSRPDVGAVDASTNPDATTNADVGPTDPTGSAVTQVSTVNPATFGMVFAQGDVPETVVLMAGDQPRQAQIDRLATWPDGSLKHARITVLEPGTFNLVTTDTTSSSTPPEMPDIDFEAQVQIDGTSWTAGLAAPSETTGGPLFAQYDLPAVTLTNAQGDEHPYLALKAWVWFYPTTGQTEVIATIENAWAQTSDDRVVTDQVAYRLDGDEVFSEDDVTIGQWTRTRAMRFWEGDPVSRHADRDMAYFQATGAVPHYDPDLQLADDALTSYRTQYNGTNHGLMGSTVVQAGMGGTGGRPEIGPLPKWGALAAISNDADALQISMDIDDSAAPWPIHLRDRDTGRPLSIVDHPTATTLSAVKRYFDANPIPLECVHDACSGDDGSDLHPNPPHEPGFGYVSYLLSTDPYYLEEMGFWQTWNAAWKNPNYRDEDQNLFLSTGQVRDKAWTLRTLGYLAWILPDGHPRKSDLMGYLDNNLEFFLNKFVHDDANDLGFVYGRLPYHNGNGIAPWQDDFLTWAMANMVRLGFSDWQPAAQWKAQFVNKRMNEACYQFAAIYSVKVRDDADSAFYTDWPTILEHSTSPDNLAQDCGTVTFGSNYEPGDFSGYPWSAQGFPANMQPALAGAVDLGLDDADTAWSTYEQRPTKQDYSSYPNWDIVPAQ